MGTVRELLNRLRWDPRSETDEVVLTVRSREGGVERMRELPFGAVRAILPEGVTLADRTFLPYHRIVAVRRAKEVMWGGPR